MEPRHDLHVVRIAELIDGRDALEFVATIDQSFRVAGKGRRIARDGNYHRYDAFGEFVCLGVGPLAWRIEYDRIEIFQFRSHEGAAKQVALLCLHGLES